MQIQIHLAALPRLWHSYNIFNFNCIQFLMEIILHFEWITYANRDSNILQQYNTTLWWHELCVDQPLCLLIIFYAHSIAYDYDIALWLFAVAEWAEYIQTSVCDGYKPMNFHSVLLICLRPPLNINHLQGCQTSLASSVLILTDIYIYMSFPLTLYLRCSQMR